MCVYIYCDICIMYIGKEKFIIYFNSIKKSNKGKLIQLFVPIEGSMDIRKEKVVMVIACEMFNLYIELCCMC